MGIVLLLNRVSYALEGLTCFFIVAGRALYGRIRCRLSIFAASLSLSLLRFRLAWPWRFACVERFGGSTGGIDCGGTSSLSAIIGKASNVGEAGGVERGEDAVEGGRERSGEVRGEELNKYVKPSSSLMLSMRSCEKLNSSLGSITVLNDIGPVEKLNCIVDAQQKKDAEKKKSLQNQVYSLGAEYSLSSTRTGKGDKSTNEVLTSLTESLDAKKSLDAFQRVKTKTRQKIKRKHGTLIARDLSHMWMLSIVSDYSKYSADMSNTS